MTDSVSAVSYANLMCFYYIIFEEFVWILYLFLSLEVKFS